MPLMNFIGNIGYVLVSVIGGVLVIQGAIPIGDILAFNQYARQFSQPINQLSSISNIIQSTIASAERVFELLDEPEEALEASDRGELVSPRGNVQFQHVSFGYAKDVPLIADMNMAVKQGQTIAIVGSAGTSPQSIWHGAAGHLALSWPQSVTISRMDVRTRL